MFDPKGGWNTVKRKSGYSSDPERREISLSSFRDTVGKVIKFPDWFASLTGGPKAPNNPVRDKSEAPAVRVSAITVSDNADDDSDDDRRYYGTKGDHEDAMRKLSKGALGSRYEALALKLMSQVEIDYSSGCNIPPGMSGLISQVLMKNEEKEPRKERRRRERARTPKPPPEPEPVVPPAPVMNPQVKTPPLKLAPITNPPIQLQQMSRNLGVQPNQSLQLLTQPTAGGSGSQLNQTAPPQPPNQQSGSGQTPPSPGGTGGGQTPPSPGGTGGGQTPPSPGGSGGGQAPPSPGGTGGGQALPSPGGAGGRQPPSPPPSMKSSKKLKKLKKSKKKKKKYSSPSSSSSSSVIRHYFCS